ncbi:hypothetical protein EXIGLDRAFT_610851, partial [Exidia glandulosa HHB12029]
VMKDLPKKTERIEWCEMTESQSTHYRSVLQRSQALATQAVTSTASKVLMDLRKAAIHPVLFRREFTDALIKEMARACKQDEQFRDANEAYIIEDMSVMTDSELQHARRTFNHLSTKFSQPDDMFLNSGKIKKFVELLDGETKRRALVLSQFTQVLDILRAVLDMRGTKYLILTGQTAFDARLGLVDEFNQDESISVFLLSTNASSSGMGLNLTAASVVILFDQNLNPHNDKQAVDCAYSIGQQNDVDVIKLISKGTIEVLHLHTEQSRLLITDCRRISCV